MSSSTRYATVHSLSTELLALTLLLAYWDRAEEATWGLLEDKLHCLENFSLVCRNWRGVILSESQFWTSCRIRVTEASATRPLDAKPRIPVHLSISSLHTFFSRSCGRPLKLAVEGDLSEEESFPLIQFLASTDCWTALSFETTSRGSWTIPLFDFCVQKFALTGINCFRNVQELCFSCTGSSGSALDGNKLPLAHLFPSLRKLDLQLDFARITNRQHLHAQLCLLHLRWLRLKGDQAHLLSNIPRANGLEFFEIVEGGNGCQHPIFNLRFSTGSSSA